MDLFKELMSQIDLEDLSKAANFKAEDLSKVITAIGSKVAGSSAGESIGIEQISKLLGGNLDSLAADISATTGIDASKLSQSLPAIFAALTAKFQQGGLNSLVEALGSKAGGGLMDVLGAALDQNKDGKVSDDLLEAAKKLF